MYQRYSKMNVLDTHIAMQIKLQIILNEKKIAERYVQQDAIYISV